MNSLIKRTSSLALCAASLLVSSHAVLAQSTDDTTTNSAAAAAGGGIGGLIGLAIGIVVIIGMWKMFVKAGQPGWACIIPIYNAYILCKIAGKPGWWVVLMLIPLVNIIIGIMVVVGIAKSFGQGTGFAVGMILLPFVFYPILGFGSATYQGPRAA